MDVNGEYRWRGGLCMEIKPVPNTIVIFGASGDLSGRKLLPALYHLYKRDLLHGNSRIVGCARTPMDDAAYRQMLREKWFSTENAELEKFLARVFYQPLDYGREGDFLLLSRRLAKIEQDVGAAPESTGRIFYLATPSPLYIPITANLGKSGLTREVESGAPARRVVLEKPFGFDLESAKALDCELHRTLKERQIYRIDHYLGKETVQNILILRFANTIFEPVWNSHYIDNVQITVAETVGVEHRAGYFDQAGLLRDMFQNHILEMLSLVAMEIPPTADADGIRDEKLKLLKSIRSFRGDEIRESVIRAQYEGYRNEPGIPPDSTTESFVAMRLLIDNWRWRNVPFYIRSGKHLKEKTSRIVITFKHIPHSIFVPLHANDLEPNRLILDVQPQEGLSLSMQVKKPGPKLCMGALSMNFKYSGILDAGESMPDAYERLLLDCMLGDQTLFIRNDTIEVAWKLLMPLLDAWKNHAEEGGPLYSYPPGSWGPHEADKLLRRYGCGWYNGNGNEGGEIQSGETGK